MTEVAPEPLLHLPNPALSLFQSAVAATEQRRKMGNDPTATPGAPAPVDHASTMMRATARAARTLVMGAPATAAALLRSGTTEDIAEFCARLYLDRALAEASRDPVRIAAAQKALPPFGTCDGGWIEALNEFLIHYPLRRHGDVPYREWKDLQDFVLPDPRERAAPAALPANARIAVISDWGTGQQRAQALLESIAELAPDIVIHLGDIYYACEQPEADAFYKNIRRVFPENSTRVFTLCGNHDMYGGGAPYYALLNRLQQPASFFCLRNAHWQFLAMDTGYNDFNPFEEQRTITWLRDGTDDEGHEGEDNYSELEWHADKIDNAGGRKTILLSHHPLFTRNSPIGGNQVCNPRLLAQVGPLLDRVTLWLWGHEHCQLIYEPFMGLQRGRCLGAGGIPTLPSENPYDPATHFAAGQTPPPGLLRDPASRLGIDPGTGWYDLGFALLVLDDARAAAAYYSFNETSGPKIVYQEQLA